MCLFKGWKSLKNLKVGVLKPILSKFYSYFSKQPVHILKAGDQLKITQNRFWPFLGVLSGFLGGPRTIYFGGLSLYFDNSLREKRSEVE